jgi:predicted DNA-binding transcriptional regulator YafY
MHPLSKQKLQVGQVMECIYLSKLNDFTKRRLKIIKISEQTLVAYCFLRKEIRSFTFDQILAYRIIETGGSIKCMQQRKRTN